MNKVEEKWRRKNKKYKLNSRITNSMIKKRRKQNNYEGRPRATGICLNWGKPKHERRQICVV
jgi:hypothetical protein